MITYGQQIDNWIKQLEDLLNLIKDNSSKSPEYDNNNIKQYLAFTIKHSQYFTFDAILTLILNGQYVDSFTLLRPFFEAHITMWRICNASSELVRDYAELSSVDDYNITVEINKLFKAKYNINYNPMQLKPIKVNHEYWDKPLIEVIDTIDKAEEESWPYHGLMFIRLYSTGSEFLHRSSYSINEGFITNAEFDKKEILISNPNMAIEAAWWASLIMIDSEKWYCKLLNCEFDSRFQALRKKSMNLASIWINKSNRK
jgi:hypothetical protein